MPEYGFSLTRFFPYKGITLYEKMWLKGGPYANIFYAVITHYEK